MRERPDRFGQLALAWLHAPDYGNAFWLSGAKDGPLMGDRRWPLVRADEATMMVVAYRHEAFDRKPFLSLTRQRPDGYTHTSALAVAYPLNVPDAFFAPLRLVA